ncbi:MAG TPA: type I 3-dehydroquinate dehydratase [Planctomycetes bacterium]|nr:type I 3-dehydroquinate dehydratase [Planctomycetota bacterium]
MTLFVASLMPKGVEEGREQGKAALRSGADLIEFRVDRLRHPSEVATLVSLFPEHSLVACRVPEDGGEWTGSVEDRRRMLMAGAQAGAAWVDLELWESLVFPPGTKAKILRSYHRLHGAPSQPAELLGRMRRSGADALKVVWMGYDAADYEKIHELYSLVPDLPLTAFLVGKAGRSSRFLSVLEGAPFLYCAPGPGQAVAEGQPDLFEAAQIYRLAEARPGDRFWGLCGSPVEHSLGYRLHNGLGRWIPDAPRYFPFETQEPEALARLLWGIHGESFLGLSVTAPHKRRAFRMAVVRDEWALACGSVNTLKPSEEGFLGFNTDAPAIARSLAAASPHDLSGVTALVVGGGGVARSACVALQSLGCRVAIAARSRKKILDFAKERGVTVLPFEASLVKDLSARVLVHATPVGQEGGAAEGESLFSEADLPHGLLALDLVYRPARTPLLDRVVRAGGKAVSGLRVFLHQAALQAEILLGVRVPPLGGTDALAVLLGPEGRELEREEDR